MTLFHFLAMEASGGGGGARWYVSKSTGNDANSGTSLGASFATIAAALAVAQPNQTIVLLDGHFRESLSSSISGLRVEVADPTVIIDGADVIAGPWTQHGVQTNTWYVERTSLAATNAYVGAWRNGALMTPASSHANCNITDGSFFVTSWSNQGETYRIYINPPSANPNSDGATYEASARLFAVNLTGANASIEGPLTVQRSQQHDGVLRMAGVNAFASDVATSGGKQHNVYLDSGRLLRVTSDGCWGSGCTDFVIIQGSADRTKTAYLEDCEVLADNNANGTGFFIHGDTIGRVHFKGCHVEGRSSAWGSSAGSQEFIILEDCSGDDFTVAGFELAGQFGTSGSQIYLIRTSLIRPNVENAYALKFGSMDSLNKIFVYRTFLNGHSSCHFIGGSSPLIHIEGSVLTGIYQGTSEQGGSTYQIECYRTIIDDVQRAWQTNNSGSSFVGDANVYFPDQQIASWKGGNYGDVASWKAAVSSDPTSVQSDPLWVSDPTSVAVSADLNTTTQSGSPAKTLKAGISDRPSSYTPPVWVDSYVAALL